MEENALLGEAVRNLGGAWRALRLYPAASPLPLQAAEAVCAVIDEYMQVGPSLRLVVTRESFTVRGLDEVFAPPGIPELADALGTHGIAELHFVSPPMPEEVVAFLRAAALQPAELRAEGGMQAVLAAGAGGIKVVAVALSTAEAALEIPEEEADKFLAELAGDPARLVLWLRAMLTYDDEGLVEGLLELARAANDLPMFGRSLAEVFVELESDGKDRLLETAIYLQPVRHIALAMIENLTVSDVTAAIRGGRFGGNLMSISWAITHVPMGDRTGDLMREMQASLLAAEHTEAEMTFLTRMSAVRHAGKPEPPLADARPLYRQVLTASALRPEHTRAASEEARGHGRLDAAGAATVLHLLDLADELELFSCVLGALSRAIPHLIESGDPRLAVDIAREGAARFESDHGWPDLDAHIVRFTQQACGKRSMLALLELQATDANAVGYATELLNIGGEASARALAEAALVSPEENAMSFAEAVVGERRLPELLAVTVGHADSRHAARLAEAFAKDGGARCLQALEQLVTHPEDQVRRETARGIAGGGSRVVSAFMPRLIRDPAHEVAIVAARALARVPSEIAVPILASRLEDAEGDRDMPLIREVVGVLAQDPSPEASAALRHAATRRTLLRKGKMGEVKRLAHEALALRAERGLV